MPPDETVPAVPAFRRKRERARFHDARMPAVALSVETSELPAHFARAADARVAGAGARRGAAGPIR